MQSPEMSVRRSTRRLTITGSSVFSASTPVVSHSVQDDPSRDSSPQWVPAEEALTFKTPKFTRLTRRTTLTKQNIFPEQEENWRTSDAAFKAPSFFIPVSPPGMQTRSRRSSMFVGNQENNSNNNSNAALKKPASKGRKPRNTTEKGIQPKDHNKGLKTTKKSVTKVNKESHLKDQNSASVPLPSNKPGQKRTAEDTVVLRNVGNLSHEPITVDTDGKKPRKSNSGLVNFSKTEDAMDMSTPVPVAATQEIHTMSAGGQMLGENYVKEDVQTLLDKPFRTPKTGSDKNLPDQVGMETEKRESPRKSIKVSSSLVKSASRFRSVKLVSEKEEIKKMGTDRLSPDSQWKFKHKYTSPNSRKAATSPARVGLLKEMGGASLRSKTRSPGQKLMELNASQATPSRAAPKARKILGVTPSNNKLNEEQEEINENDVEEYIICDEPPISLATVTDDEATSFVAENENDMTLSHTSHSQWCIIL